MSEEQARLLADLEIKRGRTAAELDTVRATARSIQQSMQAYRGSQDALHERYSTQLEADDLPEAQRLALYREWNTAFKASIDGYNDLAAERERLHVQELILVRMLTEIDLRIETLRQQLA